MEKTERQLNLTAYLLNARVPKTISSIREALYSDATSEEAFKRMFERDKEELRTLGVQVEMSPIDAWEDGYIVKRDETLLPRIDLTPAEHAALMIAAEAWGDGILGSTAPRMAALKLSAASAEPRPAPWIVPQVAAETPNLNRFLEAISRRKVATFKYRTQGASKAVSRKIEPYGISFRSAAWYVAGLDRDRGEQRMFKLLRIEGLVKIAAGKAPDYDLPADNAATWPEPESDSRGTIAVDDSLAWWAERQPGAIRTGTLADGRAELSIPIPEEARFVAWVAGLGATAEIIEPAHLRDAIAEHLRAVAGVL